MSGKKKRQKQSPNTSRAKGSGRASGTVSPLNTGIPQGSPNNPPSRSRRILTVVFNSIIILVAMSGGCWAILMHQWVWALILGVAAVVGVIGLGAVFDNPGRQQRLVKKE